VPTFENGRLNAFARPIFPCMSNFSENHNGKKLIFIYFLSERKRLIQVRNIYILVRSQAGRCLGLEWGVIGMTTGRAGGLEESP